MAAANGSVGSGRKTAGSTGAGVSSPAVRLAIDDCEPLIRCHIGNGKSLIALVDTGATECWVSGTYDSKQHASTKFKVLEDEALPIQHDSFVCSDNSTRWIHEQLQFAPGFTSVEDHKQHAIIAESSCNYIGASDALPSAVPATTSVQRTTESEEATTSVGAAQNAVEFDLRYAPAIKPGRFDYDLLLGFGFRSGRAMPQEFVPRSLLAVLTHSHGLKPVITFQPVRRLLPVPAVSSTPADSKVTTVVTTTASAGTTTAPQSLADPTPFLRAQFVIGAGLSDAPPKESASSKRSYHTYYYPIAKHADAATAANTEGSHWYIRIKSIHWSISRRGKALAAAAALSSPKAENKSAPAAAAASDEWVTTHHTIDATHFTYDQYWQNTRPDKQFGARPFSWAWVDSGYTNSIVFPKSLPGASDCREIRQLIQDLRDSGMAVEQKLLLTRIPPVNVLTDQRYCNVRLEQLGFVFDSQLSDTGAASSPAIDDVRWSFRYCDMFDATGNRRFVVGIESNLRANSVVLGMPFLRQFGAEFWYDANRYIKPPTAGTGPGTGSEVVERIGFQTDPNEPIHS